MKRKYWIYRDRAGELRAAPFEVEWLGKENGISSGTILVEESKQ